ncbi:uncharacterized protein LOC110262764 [Arachis ipaensis]|uniref:uncharacterized protein LOC110262764 n=1 Tax=Arachis ipaensis TaxID=130454 RepID=UPI000A2B8EFC|nr:uncharacterized protein LOC110262764 [Arachis ipaensis]XP_025650813.1 uncharacterized protein LOC112746913 [Arachis hypogaea]
MLSILLNYYRRLGKPSILLEFYKIDKLNSDQPSIFSSIFNIIDGLAVDLTVDFNNVSCSITVCKKKRDYSKMRLKVLTWLHLLSIKESVILLRMCLLSRKRLRNRIKFQHISSVRRVACGADRQVMLKDTSMWQTAI